MDDKNKEDNNNNDKDDKNNDKDNNSNNKDDESNNKGGEREDSNNKDDDNNKTPIETTTMTYGMFLLDLSWFWIHDKYFCYIIFFAANSEFCFLPQISFLP